MIRIQSICFVTSASAATLLTWSGSLMPQRLQTNDPPVERYCTHLKGMSHSGFCRFSLKWNACTLAVDK